MNTIKNNEFEILIYLVLFLSVANCEKNIDINNFLKKSFNSLENVFSSLPFLSTKCQEGFQNLQKGLHSNEIWALKMIDSVGKLPSGILRGNLNQYGDFDECLSVSKAKYCLAEINLSNFWFNKSIEIQNMVHSYYVFRGNVTDPAHRVPDFSTIKWGFCIPKTCSSKDLKILLENTFGFEANVKISMCKTQNFNKKTLNFGDYFARLYFTFLLMAVLFGTIFEHFWPQKQQNYGILRKILKCFAIQMNWKKITEIKKDSTSIIRGVDGVRTLSALGLIMSHKSVAMLYNPYINRNDAATGLGKAWSVIGRTAIIYTDSFMLISGFLNSKPLFEEIKTNNSLTFGKRLTTRIFRIIPSLLTIILFCTYILPILGSGPLWPLVIEHHAKLCKKYMWRNLFLVHNYFGFDNMCLTHTHQIGIDFQLYLVTPMFVYLLTKNSFKGLISVTVVIIVSTLLRFWITIKYNLSHVVYFGITIKRMFDTANLSYILPTHRASIYFMGVLLAYFFNKRQNKPIYLTKLQSTVLWVLGLSFGFLAMLGPYHMARINYQYNVWDAALYGSLSPIAWGLCIIWTIISSNMGYAGWFGNFLTWKYFQMFSKISYAVYLVQFPVFFYFVGIQRSSGEYKPYHMLELSETLLILLISIILTVTVEIPFQKIGQMLTKSNFSISAVNKNDTKIDRKIKFG